MPSRSEQHCCFASSLCPAVLQRWSHGKTGQRLDEHPFWLWTPFSRPVSQHLLPLSVQAPPVPRPRDFCPSPSPLFPSTFPQYPLGIAGGDSLYSAGASCQVAGPPVLHRGGCESRASSLSPPAPPHPSPSSTPCHQDTLVRGDNKGHQSASCPGRCYDNNSLRVTREGSSLNSDS